VARHIIVDGSNIATEGRSTPSLTQLNEAVLALMQEYPGAKVSVVVDATFGHRIARKEVAEFNKAIDHNELVAPPAGAVGRGDAFVLAIAEKVRASVLSNDSYQEFHGKHKWLFDPGRLIGGKPVPHVGWVFVERLPVRGAVSKRSTKEGRVVAKTHEPSLEASKPMPVPKAPPPGAKPGPGAKSAPSQKAVAASQRSAANPRPAVAPRSPMANDVMPYLQFVEKNKVGSRVKATVAEYTSNGATVRIGDVNGYVSLKHMASPPARSAREMFKIGDSVQLVIVGYTPSRRSVDLGVPEVVASLAAPVKSESIKKTKKKAAPAKRAATKRAGVPVKSAARKSVAPAGRRPVRKSAAPAKKTTKSAARKSVAPAKKTTKSAARKSVAPARRRPVKKAAATARKSAATRK